MTGSASKGAYHQAWLRKLHPWSPHGGRRTLTLVSCLVTSRSVLWHTQACLPSPVYPPQHTKIIRLGRRVDYYICAIVVRVNQKGTAEATQWPSVSFRCFCRDYKTQLKSPKFSILMHGWDRANLQRAPRLSISGFLYFVLIDHLGNLLEITLASRTGVIPGILSVVDQ